MRIYAWYIRPVLEYTAIQSQQVRSQHTRVSLHLAYYWPNHRGNKHYSHVQKVAQSSLQLYSDGERCNLLNMTVCSLPSRLKNTPRLIPLSQRLSALELS